MSGPAHACHSSKHTDDAADNKEPQTVEAEAEADEEEEDDDPDEGVSSSSTVLRSIIATIVSEP